ncbi:MAG: hypothetical protein IPL47_10425 [Phyllobacteriaceae bacterium]|nr:hypothetical protein [Phyllobacteriaceae bacterium]
MNGLLLDTCAVIWTGLDAKVDEPGKSAINAANAAGDEIAVSKVTALELGMLASRGKPKFPVDPKVWFHKYMERSGARLIDMAPDLLVDSCFLPAFRRRTLSIASSLRPLDTKASPSSPATRRSSPTAHPVM